MTRNKEDPIKRIEALIEKHQGVPGRFENLMNHIADKLGNQVGTYEKITINSNDWDEALIIRADDALKKFNQLLVSFKSSREDQREGFSPATLSIRFKDRQ